MDVEIIKRSPDYVVAFYDKYKNVYPDNLDIYVSSIYEVIFPLYGRASFGDNDPEDRTKNICRQKDILITKIKKNIGEGREQFEGLTLGRIIITKWLPRVDSIRAILEANYGPIGLTIGQEYNALVYVKINTSHGPYHIAIETRPKSLYALQFYIASNIDDFSDLIKMRYQCSDFKISNECDKSWRDIAASSGGYKHKTKKYKNKKYNKKYKNKTYNKKYKNKTYNKKYKNKTYNKKYKKYKNNKNNKSSSTS